MWPVTARLAGCRAGKLHRLCAIAVDQTPAIVRERETTSGAHERPCEAQVGWHACLGGLIITHQMPIGGVFILKIPGSNWLKPGGHHFCVPCKLTEKSLCALERVRPSALGKKVSNCLWMLCGLVYDTSCQLAL